MFRYEILLVVLLSICCGRTEEETEEDSYDQSDYDYWYAPGLIVDSHNQDIHNISSEDTGDKSFAEWIKEHNNTHHDIFDHFPWTTTPLPDNSSQNIVDIANDLGDLLSSLNISNANSAMPKNTHSGSDNILNIDLLQNLTDRLAAL